MDMQMRIVLDSFVLSSSLDRQNARNQQASYYNINKNNVFTCVSRKLIEWTRLTCPGKREVKTNKTIPDILVERGRETEWQVKCVLCVFFWGSQTVSLLFSWAHVRARKKSIKKLGEPDTKQIKKDIPKPTAKKKPSYVWFLETEIALSNSLCEWDMWVNNQQQQQQRSKTVTLAMCAVKQ